MWDQHIANKITSFADARYFARKRAPRGIFNAYQAGSGAGITTAANIKAFEDVWFRPYAGVFKPNQDLSTTVAGHRLDTPIYPSSVGGLKGAHRDGELAATHAAGRVGTLQFVSGVTTTPIEEIVKEATGPVFQQIYYLGSRDATAAVFERSAAAGVDGLVLIMDSPAPAFGAETLPNNRAYIPTRITAREAMKFFPQLLRRPAWALDFLADGLQAPSAQYTSGPDGKPLDYFSAVMTLFNETPTFEDIAWIREHWTGSLMLKGIIRADDARRAVDSGVDGIVVSNRGGNMLDTTIPTLQALPPIVEAVGDQIDVLLDGGIRRGSDVVKALALGAKAVGIGSAYVNALLAAGEPGVVKMMELLRNEVIMTLRQLGVNTVREIDPSQIVLPPQWDASPPKVSV